MSDAVPAPRIIGIRWIVASAVAALITLIVLVAGALSERNARDVLSRQLEARLMVQSQNLALSSAGALVSEFPELTLQPIVNQMREREPELEFVAVVNRGGRIAGHTDVRMLGASYQAPAGLREDPNAPLQSTGQTLMGNLRLLVASTPVIVGGVHVGQALVALRRDSIDRALARSRRQQLLALAGFLVLGVGSALLLVTILLRPIRALRAGLERIGRGDLDTPLEVSDRTELGALAGTLNRMAAELRVAQSRMVERERLAHEMDLAQQIQRSLLPPCRIVAGRYVIDGGQQAAARVGGDFYDILDLPGGRVGVVIADVAGKGVAGSLITAMLKALVRALAPAHASPAALMVALDDQLGVLLERNSFVTMFYGVLDPAHDTLTFSSAGHNPLLVLRAADEPGAWLRARGPALGALRGLDRRPVFESRVLAIQPGDVLVQFTDGISEALAPDGHSQFGLDRLAESALRARAAGAPEVLRALSQAVANWRGSAEQHDDETLLVIARRATSAAQPAESGEDATAGWGDTARALADLAEAESHGHRLTLPASLPALVRVDDWLAGIEPFRLLGPRPANLVRLALHEACSNVVEHACHRDPAQRFDLWWVPSAGTHEAVDPVERVAGGWFLLRDRGEAFDDKAWRPKRLEDPAVRQQGRGFGLEILHRVATRLLYCPGTPEGNLMRLALDPEVLADREEAS